MQWWMNGVDYAINVANRPPHSPPANIPIVHFSVKWWRALHQPSTILGPEPSPIAAPIAAALFVNWVAFTLLFLYLLLRRVELARLEDAWAPEARR